MEGPQFVESNGSSVTLYGKETLGELSWLRESNMVGLVEPLRDKKPAVRSEEAIGKAIEDIIVISLVTIKVRSYNH